MVDQTYALAKNGVYGQKGGVYADALDETPDSGDLQARYDATELSLSDQDSVTTWGDETGNGHDLTAGTAPTYISNGINGNPVVRFDGVDDVLDVAFASQSQPNQIFIAFEMVTVDDTASEGIFDADTDGGHLVRARGNGNFSMFAGSNLDGPATDTNAHIFGGLFDGANSTFRLDGSQANSGDPGSNALDGVTLGAHGGRQFYGNVDVGEVLVYPQDKSGIQGDVEQYLSDKWGITL
jgi:hypothetical protein